MRKDIQGADRRSAAGALLVAGCGRGGPGGGDDAKISDDKIVLAVLNDQSGVYADLSGKNSVEAVRMAVADFQAKYGDKAVTSDIEVVTADHQNKPDIANSKAQELYDRQQADIDPRRADLVGGAGRGRTWPRRRRSSTSTSARPPPS